MRLRPRPTCVLLARAAAIALSTMLLVGCFSMSPVPPHAGLRPIESPDAHAAARFDGRAPREIESDWGPEGTFVLVHPILNGRDVGWFLFDTGASGCTITAVAAAAAGLPAIGSTLLQGTEPSTLYDCDSLTLGPLTLTGLHMTGLNFHHASGAFGRPVVGILGRNVCASSVVELDGPRRSVRLHDPDGVRLADERLAVAVTLRYGVPFLRATFPAASDSGRRDGLFLLDTGADVAVHFVAAAVESAGLAHAPGVRITGGGHQRTFGSLARVDTGSIDVFEVGAQQFGPLAVTFARSGDLEARALRDADGLIGMGLLRTCTVFLDEPHGRITFVRESAIRSARD